jgi:hypothetical protein
MGAKRSMADTKQCVSSSQFVQLETRSLKERKSRAHINSPSLWDRWSLVGSPNIDFQQLTRVHFELTQFLLFVNLGSRSLCKEEGSG